MFVRTTVNAVAKTHHSADDEFVSFPSIVNFYNKLIFSIPRQVSNSRPLDNEFHPVTTKPGADVVN